MGTRGAAATAAGAGTAHTDAHAMTNNPSELRALRDAAFAALNGGDYRGASAQRAWSD